MSNILDSVSPKDKLIIRLSCQVNEPIYWYLKLKEDDSFQFGKLYDHIELKNIYTLSHYDVTVLIPTSFIIYRKIELKGRRVIRNLKQLKFSFEKTIAGDVDNFHIVILKHDKNFCYIAAVEHEMMNRWMTWLNDAGISVSLIIPDVLTLPFREGKWSLLKLENQSLIRDSDVSGFSIRDDILQKLQLTKLIDLPKNTFCCTSDQIEKLQPMQFCEALSIMTKNIDNNGTNFLTGKYYRYRKRTSNRFSLLRIMSLALLFSIGIFFNSLHYNYMIERDIDMLNEVVQNFYVRYPSVKQYHLDSQYVTHYNNSNLSDNIFGNDFISMLYASSIFIESIDNTINSINFNSDEKTIVFNLDYMNDELLEHDVDKIELDGVSVSKVPYDNETYNIVFKYLL
ncbi:type II secretion system protein GspL [Yersinia alsatica]|uniref:type II secretion system protein GspL n=1 Tax=Yersinia alsatica TaxID=2890317 RepID=UPI0032EFA357